MKKHFPQFLFLFFVLLITTAFFGLIGGFFLAIFWAIVFAILFHGSFEWIKKKMPHKPNTAAALTLGMILLIVIIPIVLISFAVFFEASDAVQTINESDLTIETQVEDIQEQIPLDKKQLKRLGFTTKDIEDRISELVNNGTQLVAGKAIEFTQNLFGILVNFFLMMYILFFFLRDGKRLVQELMWIIPIKDKAEMTLLLRFESVARATVKGSLVVAFIQGAIGGLLFWILGIPAAFLWGIIMILTSLLPVGSAIIWLPWAIALFVQGETTKGIILVAIGAGLIGLIDNFLRPRLVGQDTKMPDYLILLSTLGGLAWFGISGFVLGPIVAAIFITCWQILGKEYGKSYDLVVTEPTAEELIEKGKREG